MFGAVLLAFAVTVAAAPCAAQSQSPPGKKPASTEEKPGTNLAHEIHHQIQVLPFYSVFDHVAFKLEGAKVTLTGQVLRPTMREQAEAAIKSLEGVTVVVNQIELLPASPSDDELRRAIYRAIYEDSTLARYAVQAVPPIHIIVKNGNVALEGFVESPGDKSLAGARGGGVPNVASIKNNLVVQGKGSAGE